MTLATILAAITIGGGYLAVVAIVFSALAVAKDADRRMGIEE